MKKQNIILLLLGLNLLSLLLVPLISDFLIDIKIAKKKKDIKEQVLKFFPYGNTEFYDIGYKRPYLNKSIWIDRSNSSLIFQEGLESEADISYSQNLSEAINACSKFRYFHKKPWSIECVSIQFDSEIPKIQMYSKYPSIVGFIDNDNNYYRNYGNEASDIAKQTLETLLEQYENDNKLSLGNWNKLKTQIKNFKNDYFYFEHIKSNTLKKIIPGVFLDSYFWNDTLKGKFSDWTSNDNCICFLASNNKYDDEWFLFRNYTFISKEQEKLKRYCYIFLIISLLGLLILLNLSSNLSNKRLKNSFERGKQDKYLKKRN